MIEFIQDYVTKALPPESFKDGQQVSDRSAESELYFVRLGVAGYVVNGKLVDQDFQPIVRQTVLVVATTDRRFADTGRGGEVIGLDAPQRATSGPGNEALFSGQQESTTLNGVEFEQLRGDLAFSRGEFETYRSTSEGEIDRLKGLIDVGTEAFRTADTAFGEERTKLTAERDQALRDLGELRTQHDSIVDEYERAREELDRRGDRIVELERQLSESTTKPAKAK